MVADKDLDSDPGTAAFVPDFDDTGEDSVPFVPNFDDTGSQPLPRVTESTPKDEPEHESEGESSAAPVAVPGRYQYVKWWKLLLVLLGVWFAAAEVGLSLFYWWYHTVDKTAAVYMVLVYVVACVVAGVILAMVQGRPMMSALALGVMSGPFASVAAAAPLYGYYYCERVGHCLGGLIPY
ncbi:hypothetical protein [Mycobacterium sp.]|uniref:hypothetical protein n=1 Tax=Mycobacterium sp. TaxID=1785 RepID=UPI003C784634